MLYTGRLIQSSAFSTAFTSNFTQFILLTFQLLARCDNIQQRSLVSTTESGHLGRTISTNFYDASLHQPAAL